MNVLLINPYITNQYFQKRTLLGEPLGLLCLATYIRDRCGDFVNISILDLYAEGWNRTDKIGPNHWVSGRGDSKHILSCLNELKPDVVGIQSNFTSFEKDSIRIAGIVKQYRDIPVVLGGAHATIEAGKILDMNSCIDFVVMGEGEVTFKKLLRTLRQQSKDFSLVKGLAWRTPKGKVVINRPRDLIRDIDELPIPDRSFIDMKIYLKINRKLLPFTRQTPIATLTTSRGCPYNCVFCSSSVVWRRKWRPRSAGKVISEIHYLVKKYGIKEVVIHDDQFLGNPDRVALICNHFTNHPWYLSFSMPTGISYWLLNSRLLKKMKAAGFYRLCYSIETGNERMRAFVGKPVDFKRAKEIIALTNSLGYWTQGNFIIGFPHETREEILETINWACKSGLDFPLFFIVKPHAGSRLTTICKGLGLDISKHDITDMTTTNMDTLELTAGELNKLIKYTAKKALVCKGLYLLNPLNTFRFLRQKIHSWQDFKYFLKVVKNVWRVFP